MTRARLIAVVGPSGVGKDSVMAGICAALPGMHLVRRVITRAPGLAGEAYDAVTPQQFDAMRDAGDFSLHWRAHGLRYGIPTQETRALDHGTACLVNLSRSVLSEANAAFPGLKVLNITATPETLASRLAARGRENDAEIAERLIHAERPLPEGLDITPVPNDGPLSETVEHALSVLAPARVS
ncbi:phosphonate metabolism protein/1,5-bisphosphokinase (PRPP-forming) PhnN [uncultured Roseobacter sp.]|uniref:phosphonate metabolism protein/1,5-bisphosphokinase (PRPP-forming) PhnN n=1 Tax=uncultured Roseobacter sp. TaxID=114847 RepID=UPI002618C556|nr:phosphonate metabolism protein/1,5-bisphosphokinase (PRPP-forming) PhnN [uncultured Roseobacter sp.]